MWNFFSSFFFFKCISLNQTATVRLMTKDNKQWLLPRHPLPFCRVYFSVLLRPLLLPPTEMHCHVYGSLYGCLEHCVPNIQLKITEGKSSHVNVPSPLLSLPRAAADSENECSAALEAASCAHTDVSWQQHTINFCHNTSQTGKQGLRTLGHDSVSVDIFYFCWGAGHQ